MVELAGEADMRLGPQRLHDAHLFRRAAAAIVEILVEPLKLDLVPADPDPEPEPAAAQDVERGRLLRDQHRLALRQDQDAGGKADLPGAAGEKAEQHERIVVGVRRGADAPPAMIGGGIGAEHVIGRQKVREAEPFGGLGIVAQYRRTGADIGHR